MRYLVGSLLLFVNIIFAQISGCTDSNANNYNSSATVNNGSCTYNNSFQSVTEIGLLTPSVPESSGIIFDSGFIWTHNDSGNPNKFYKINPNTAALVQTLTLTNFQNTDWEDITSDNNYFYLGDFGNNNGDRTDLKVIRISKSQFINSTNTSVSVTGEAINFSYLDQTDFTSNSLTNFDCESIISIGNFLYLFSKDRGDFKTRVYKLSKTPGSYVLAPFTSYNTNGLITGADFNSTTNEVVLIGYLSNKKNSFLFYLNDFNTDFFFSGNVRRVEIGNSSNDWQTEGVAYKNTNELFISCESSSYTNAKLYSSNKSSIQLDTPNFLNSEDIQIIPNPFNNILTITAAKEIYDIQLLALDGRIVMEKKT